MADQETRQNTHPDTSHWVKTAQNPTVFWLGMVALFADISSEMLYPITPIFLSTVLGASMTSIGWIEGVAEGLASGLKVFSGVWTDRFGQPRRLVALGYFLSAIAKPWIGLAGRWPTVLAARSLDRLGKGIRTAPRDAWLAAAVPDGDRGAAFGWHRGMDSFGAFIGPLLALLFISGDPQKLRVAYAWAFIPGMLAVVFVFFVKDQARQPKAKAAPLGRLKASVRFKRFLPVWCLFSLVNSSDAFLLLRTSRAGVSLVHVVLMYCAYNLIYALLSPILGHLSDQIGRPRVLRLGLLVFGLVYFGFAEAQGEWQFLLLFAIYGIYMAATDGVGKALATDLLSPTERGTGLGWLGFLSGICMVFASVVAGYLWDHVGAAAPFIYGSVGSLLAFAGLSLVRDDRLLPEAGG